jgi:hypothetical protein
MDFKKTLNSLINDLDYEQSITFALSCLFRQKHLPKLFIDSNTWGIEEINKIFPKNNIEDKLNEIINKVNLRQTNEIDVDLEILDKYLLDFEDENSIEYSLFFNYVCIIIYLLEYLKQNDIEKIEWCSNKIIESVDTIKTREYEIKMNLEDCYIVDKKMKNFLKIFTDAEEEKEIEIIKFIKSEDNEGLHGYIENNKIEYNL